MRDIKFRAWDVRHKEMRYINDLYFFEEEGIHEIVNGVGQGSYVECKIMQYTGLKDKNGTEIYESDLIQFSDWTPKEVIYEGGDGLAGYRLKGTDLFMMGFESNEYEVVGNIYEEE